MTRAQQILGRIATAPLVRLRNTVAEDYEYETDVTCICHAYEGTPNNIVMTLTIRSINPKKNDRVTCINEESLEQAQVVGNTVTFIDSDDKCVTLALYEIIPIKIRIY